MVENKDWKTILIAIENKNVKNKSIIVNEDVFKNLHIEKIEPKIPKKFRRFNNYYEKASVFVRPVTDYKYISSKMF